MSYERREKERCKGQIDKQRNMREERRESDGVRMSSREMEQNVEIDERQTRVCYRTF